MTIDSALTEDRPNGEYLAGAIDLLGVFGYGTLTAFERLADDARAAPTLADKVVMAQLAARQMGHFDRVEARLVELGADAMTAMRPFHAPFDAFHAHTAPKDWLEGLLKTYVGDGFTADFYREVAALVDSDTRQLIIDVLSDDTAATFIVSRVTQSIRSDRRVAGRLALWGRRLVGEALSQAQRVAADRDALTSLLTGTLERPGLDLAGASRVFTRLIERHTERMAKLGLES